MLGTTTYRHHSVRVGRTCPLSRRTQIPYASPSRLVHHRSSCSCIDRTRPPIYSRRPRITTATVTCTVSVLEMSVIWDVPLESGNVDFDKNDKIRKTRFSQSEMISHGIPQVPLLFIITDKSSVTGVTKGDGRLSHIVRLLFIIKRPTLRVFRQVCTKGAFHFHNSLSITERTSYR